MRAADHGDCIRPVPIARLVCPLRPSTGVWYQAVPAGNFRFKQVGQMAWHTPFTQTNDETVQEKMSSAPFVMPVISHSKRSKAADDGCRH